MTTERCPHNWDQGRPVPFGPRCSQEPGHEGPHLYKCANPACEGTAIPASELAHQHPAPLPVKRQRTPSPGNTLRRALRRSKR